MRFRTGGGLDPSQVEDRRGAGGPLVLGGGGLGLAGIVVYLLFALLGGGSGGTYGGLEGLTVAQPQAPSQSLGTECGDGRGAVLLPVRQARLHRPRLLPGAARPLRRAGWAVRGGVRDRARVRPPHAGPAGRPPSR